MATSKSRAFSSLEPALRLDFPTARLAAPGIFMVGEAVGLVNPLTGEGGDYGLESAEVAVGTLLRVLRAGPPPERAVETYTRGLRARFLRGFVNIGRFRDLYFQPWVLNRFVRAANPMPRSNCRSSTSPWGMWTRSTRCGRGRCGGWSLDKMTPSLAGHFAVITGAGREPGAGLALALGRAGARVVLVDLNPAAVQRVADTLKACKCDIRYPSTSASPS